MSQAFYDNFSRYPISEEIYNNSLFLTNLLVLFNLFYPAYFGSVIIPGFIVADLLILLLFYSGISALQLNSYIRSRVLYTFKGPFSLNVSGTLESASLFRTLREKKLTERYWIIGRYDDSFCGRLRGFCLSIKHFSIPITAFGIGKRIRVCPRHSGKMAL